jgi:hypothetical protein
MDRGMIDGPDLQFNMARVSEIFRQRYFFPTEARLALINGDQLVASFLGRQKSTLGDDRRRVLDLRSAMARACASVTRKALKRASTTTKSLPRPFILRKGRDMTGLIWESRS